MADPAAWGDEEQLTPEAIYGAPPSPAPRRKRDIVWAEFPRTLCTVILVVVVVQLMALANQTSGTLASVADLSQQQSYSRQMEAGKGAGRFREPVLTPLLPAPAPAPALRPAPQPRAAQPLPAPAPASVATSQHSLPPGAIVVVFGTRPEAIKMLPVIAALRAGAGAHPVVLINSGQHDALLDETLAGLGEDGAGVAIDLNIAASALGGAAETVGALLAHLGPLFRAQPPACAVVQGDTSTAAAAAQAAYLTGIPVAHVEAGLRSFSPATPFPEDFYRTLITSTAVLHLAPTHHAANQLAGAGGAARGRVHVVGNTGVDGLLAQLKALATPAGAAPATAALAALFQGTSLTARTPLLPRLARLALHALENTLPEAAEGAQWGAEPPSPIGLPVYAKLCHPFCASAGSASEGPTCLHGALARDFASTAIGVEDVWVVFTMHRRESWGAGMAGIVSALGDLILAAGGKLHIVWPMHPNPTVAEAMREGLASSGAASHREGGGAASSGAHGSGLLESHFHVLEPLPPASTAALLLVADAVVTDSGGLQEEAVTLGRHVFVTRETTERPEGMAGGLMHLVGLDKEALKKQVTAWMVARCGARFQASARAARTYGDGHAGKRSAAIILAALDSTAAGKAVGWVPDGQAGAPAYAATAAAVGAERGGVERVEVPRALGLAAAPVDAVQAEGVRLNPEKFRVGGAAEAAGDAAVVATAARVARAAAAAAAGVEEPVEPPLPPPPPPVEPLPVSAVESLPVAALPPPPPPPPPPPAEVHSVSSLSNLFGKAAGEAAPAALAPLPAPIPGQPEDEATRAFAEHALAVTEAAAAAAAEDAAVAAEAAAAAASQAAGAAVAALAPTDASRASSSGGSKGIKRLFGSKGKGRGLLDLTSLASSLTSAISSTFPGGSGGGGSAGSRGAAQLVAEDTAYEGALSAVGHPFRRLVSASTPFYGLPAHERFARRHQCSTQPPDPGILEETYADIMASPSAYSLGRDGLQTGPFTWTAILGTFRRVAFLERMITSLLAQAHPPVEVWVTTFSSPHAEALEAVTRKFVSTKVKFVGGDPQLKYFGRFQLAFQAPSTHVAFFDDDCIPGDHAVSNAFHVMYTLHRRYYGLIGMKGHWGNVETPVTHVQHPYHLQWEYRPLVAKAVDLTGGMWFLRKDWLHTMWRDNPFTLETGEDFQLTYTLRKYMGINTFLLPNDELNPATWAHSKDYFDVAKGTESTNGRLWDMRPIIFYNMIQRGYTPVMHHETWGEHHTGSNVLVVIDAAADAVALRGLLEAIRLAYPHAIRPLLVLTGGPGAGRAEEEVLKALGRAYTPQICCYVGTWDLYLRKLDPQLYRAGDVFGEVLVGMRGVIETTRPALILVPHRRGSPITRAVAEVGGEMGVPVAALLLPDWEAPQGKLLPSPLALSAAPNVNTGVGWSASGLEGRTIEQAAADMAQEAAAVLTESQEGVFSGALWDAVPSALSSLWGSLTPTTALRAVQREEGGSSTGGGRALDASSPMDAPVTAAFTYATSSAGLMLRYIEEQLCVCAKEDSKGVGAYAQCPWATQIKPTPTPAPHASDREP